MTENILKVTKHYSHSITSFTKCHWNGDGFNHMLTLFKFLVDYTVCVKTPIFGSRLRSSKIFVEMHGCDCHTAKAKHSYRWLSKKARRNIWWGVRIKANLPETSIDFAQFVIGKV